MSAHTSVVLVSKKETQNQTSTQQLMKNEKFLNSSRKEQATGPKLVRHIHCSLKVKGIKSIRDFRDELKIVTSDS